MYLITSRRMSTTMVSGRCCLSCYANCCCRCRHSRRSTACHIMRLGFGIRSCVSIVTSLAFQCFAWSCAVVAFSNTGTVGHGFSNQVTPCLGYAHSVLVLPSVGFCAQSQEMLFHLMAVLYHLAFCCQGMMESQTRLRFSTHQMVRFHLFQAVVIATRCVCRHAVLVVNPTVTLMHWDLRPMEMLVIIVTSSVRDSHSLPLWHCSVMMCTDKHKYYETHICTRLILMLTQRTRWTYLENTNTHTHVGGRMLMLPF